MTENKNMNDLLKDGITTYEGINIYEYKNKLREYTVGLIEGIKNGDNDCFDELMEIKDMKNFVYYYTFHIRKFHRYKHPEDEVMHEVMIIVFKHIKYNYRIYNEPHEVSLLINSMRTKVRFEASSELSNMNPYSSYSSPSESNSYSDEEFIKEITFDDMIERHLNNEESKIVEMRIRHGLAFHEIGSALGYSKDTAFRRYRRAIHKLKHII